MTAPLKDLRAKVTPETWCVIEARHRVTGEQHAEIVRGILHDWALSELQKAKVMQGLLLAEGIGGNVRDWR